MPSKNSLEHGADGSEHRANQSTDGAKDRPEDTDNNSNRGAKDADGYGKYEDTGKNQKERSKSF